MADRIQATIADVFQLPVDEVRDELAFNESPKWDSMNHINLMLALEDAFGIAIGDDDVVELTSVAAIRRYLAERGVQATDGVA